MKGYDDIVVRRQLFVRRTNVGGVRKDDADSDCVFGREQFILVCQESTLGEWLAAQPGAVWLALGLLIALWVGFRRRRGRAVAAPAE